MTFLAWQSKLPRGEYDVLAIYERAADKAMCQQIPPWGYLDTGLQHAMDRCAFLGGFKSPVHKWEFPDGTQVTQTNARWPYWLPSEEGN